MKKIYSLALLAAVSLGAFAQQEEEPSLYLSNFESQIAGDSEEGSFSEFYYNEENLVDSILWSSGELIHSNAYTYENGNIISMQNYTVDAFGSSAGFFIEYSYDEQGRVIERKNYNNYGTGLVLAGRIEYYYDETTGSLVTEKCYTVFWEGESMTSYIEYSYDRSGRLVKEDTYTDSNVSARIEYIYDEDGRLSEQLDYLLSENGTELVLSRKTDRTYDENGNPAAEKTVRTAGILIIWKRILITGLVPCRWMSFWNLLIC